MKDTNSKIVSIGGGREDMEAKRKQDMIDVIDAMRLMVQSGEISEFVAASIDDDGITKIHVCSYDLPGGIGLFEIGKHLLIAGETGTIDLEID
jgi:hypothetical protein|tara:strand:+ start:982 stop:1260 length:279 start_codon:yes stop_codon:yes gene_type:complete